MFQVGKAGSATAAASEATQAVSSPIVTGGAVEGGGFLSHEKDATESATAPKFGDVYKQIQAKYGERPEKPREIKKTLGKDDFLRIMLTQMKNQDPTNPFKPEQMATEIAQFTSVEQLQNVNQNLNKMESQNKSYGQMAMTHLIGKTVTIDRERFPHVEGQSESLNFKLPRNSASTQIAVVSELGEVVLEKELGPENAGEVTFLWDGIKSNTVPAKSGNYSLRVEAKNEKGQPIETNPQTQAKVIGVSFEGSEPVFLVGDAHHYDKVTMKNIVRVDTDMPASPPVSVPTQLSNTTAQFAGNSVAKNLTAPNNIDQMLPPPAALNNVDRTPPVQAPSNNMDRMSPAQTAFAQAMAQQAAAVGPSATSEESEETGSLYSNTALTGNGLDQAVANALQAAGQAEIARQQGHTSSGGAESPYRAAALTAAANAGTDRSQSAINGRLENIQNAPNFIPFNNFAEGGAP